MYGRIVSQKPVILPTSITPRHWAGVPGVTYPAEKTPPLTTIPPGYATAATLAKQLGISSASLRNTLRAHHIPRQAIFTSGGIPRNIYHAATVTRLYRTLHPGSTLSTLPPGWLTTTQARTILRCSHTSLMRKEKNGTLRTLIATLPDTNGTLRKQKLYHAADCAKLAPQ